MKRSFSLLGIHCALRETRPGPSCRELPARTSGDEMGSWVNCLCGNLLNKNLFAGNACVLLVPEEQPAKTALGDR